MKPATDRARAIAQVVLLAGAVRVVAWFTTSPDARLPSDQLFASTFLAVGHAALYWFHAPFRASKGSVPYFGAQVTLVLAIGLYSLSLWITLALAATLLTQLYGSIAGYFFRRRGRKTS